MSKNKTGSSDALAGTQTEHRPKKRFQRFHKLVALVLAALMLLGTAATILVSRAYAGTTGTTGGQYQLYDSSTTYSYNGHHTVDGNSAFCMQFDSVFANGITVTKHDAVAVYGQTFVTRIALYRAYIYSLTSLNSDQKFFITQTLIWETQNAGRFPGGLRLAALGVSDANQTKIKDAAKAYYNTNKDSYIGGGTFWQADAQHQNLAEFWIVRRTVGKITLVKASSNPTATNGNSRYSLAGAVYTIYDSSNKAVGTLTVNASGTSNTVSNLPVATYTVKETTAPPGYEKNTTVYTARITADGQTITVNAKDDPILGKIELQKSSSNPSITDGNKCYRLDGAQYGIYRTESDAKAHANRYASIATNASGFGSKDALPLGQYWVREYKAPEGYWLDDTIYFVDITSSKTTVQVASKDIPKNDPIGILLNKLDADTGLPYAGSEKASLEGAQFTVKYYDAQHATVSAAQAATPKRTWVLRTDADGYCLFDDEYLVSGDPLYKNSAGDATIPIGTFTVQETKAPEGYLLSTPLLPNSVRLFHITDDGTNGEFLHVYNAQKVREQIKRGDIEIMKYQEDEITTPELPSELKTPEVGVTFDLYASRDFTGTTIKSGAVPALSLITNEDGVASTINAGVVMLQWPDGTYSTRARTANDSGALPYDTYLVVQRDVPDGYSPANRFTVTVSEDKVKRTYIVGNTLIPAAIRIEKVDSETGVAVPYPAKWQVLDAKTQEPISMTIHYPKTQVLDTFESAEDGWLLLPEMLPVGSYLLKEIEAPKSGTIGYLINPALIPFKVTERHEWDNPLVVTCADAPAKGQINLIKSDALNGERVQGAEYAVYAIDDVFTLDGTLRYSAGSKVDTLHTDGNGEATSSELYLGSYSITEIATPNGFAMNPTIYSVDLVYKGQTATVNIENVDATNEPTTLEIKKVDVSTGKPLGGVVFAVEDCEGEVTLLTTDSEGFCDYPYLLRGDYKVYEVETVAGYILSDVVLDVTVDENGLINGQASFELLFVNDFTKVEISKTDIVTGEPVIGALMQVFAVDDEGNASDVPFIEWTTTEQPHYVERFAKGNYILRETIAPLGFVVAQDIAFSVEETAPIQRVEMQDDFTKLEIVKVDAGTGKLLPGATLQVIDAEGKVVFEWETTGLPFIVERIAQGKYTLRETKAPAGYELAQDIEFSVEDTASVQKVSMVDKRIPTKKLDQTGRDANVPFGVVGTLALVALTGTLIAIKQLRKPKDSYEEDVVSNDTPDESETE